MISRPEPTRATLAEFQVYAPVFVAETGLATVWKVQQHNGTPAALKCYHDAAMPDEGPGFSWLAACDGQGAAKLYAISHGAALLEWLDGRSLGDLSRSGHDTQANAKLVQTACRLHAHRIKATDDMPQLIDWFSALRTTAPPNDLQTQTNFARSQNLAAQLLASQTDIRALHGDLHHDNIKDSARGHLAFDAKGIIGDRAYELANGFLNPLGAQATLQDANRIKHLAQSWGQAFDVKPEILLDWACAHAGLSAAWHIRDGNKADMTMLNLLWGVRDGLQ